jgi:Bacteriophage tail sheath protein
MTVQVTYPGVYIDEIPSGVHTITGVATSITAFVGAATEGPTDTPITVNNFGEYSSNFGGASLSSPMSFAVSDFFRNGGSQAIIVRVAGSGSGTAEFDIGTTTGKASFLALGPGKWANQLKVTADSTGAPSGAFNLTVTYTDPTSNNVTQTEKFFNLTLGASDARYYATIVDTTSQLIITKRDTTGAVVDVPTTLPSGSSTFPATGGADGSAPTWTNIGDTTGSLQANKQGLYALDKVDIFNILVIPPFAFGTDLSASNWSDAVAYCHSRRAFLLVDPPQTWNSVAAASSGVATGYSNMTYGENAAIFFPRIVEPNPLKGNVNDTFAPSGALAGIFARTDGTRGVWKAPAGIETGFTGVNAMSFPLNDADSGILNPLGVNCLRAFPIIGRVVWGSRTLVGADLLANQWKYIPVRRMALFLEESLYRGTQWVVFEPNDSPLWAQIRLNVGAFMQQLFRQGAFQGASATDAYFVKCDSETTTQADINNGIVNIIVGFAPLKPAEFVIIHLQQIAGQITT